MEGAPNSHTRLPKYDVNAQQEEFKKCYLYKFTAEQGISLRYHLQFALAHGHGGILQSLKQRSAKQKHDAFGTKIHHMGTD